MANSSRREELPTWVCENQQSLTLRIVAIYLQVRFLAKRMRERAVSPVISVILMVAVTVILASVVSVFGLGLGEGLSNPAPSANFGYEVLDNGDIQVTHESGTTLNGDQLRFAGAALEKTSFGGISEWSGNVESGDSATVDVRGGETLQLIWQSPNGDSTATLAEYDVPDDVGPTASIGSITANDGEMKITVNNIQFSRVGDGEIDYEVTQKRVTTVRGRQRTSIKKYTDSWTDEGNEDVGTNRISDGDEITVIVYEKGKSTKLDSATCTVGSPEPSKAC